MKRISVLVCMALTAVILAGCSIGGNRSGGDKTGENA